jgi:hypothetical protein
MCVQGNMVDGDAGNRLRLNPPTRYLYFEAGYWTIPCFAESGKRCSCECGVIWDNSQLGSHQRLLLVYGIGSLTWSGNSWHRPRQCWQVSLIRNCDNNWASLSGSNADLGHGFEWWLSTIGRTLPARVIKKHQPELRELMLLDYSWSLDSIESKVHCLTMNSYCSKPDVARLMPTCIVDNLADSSSLFWSFSLPTWGGL